MQLSNAPLFTVLLVSIMTVACGGGSSDTDATASTTSGRGSPGNDPIDRYIGTWSNICDTWSESDVTDSNGKGVSVIHAIAYRKTSVTQAKYTYTVKVFAANDPFCTGAPVANVVMTGGNTQNVSVAGNTLTADLGSNQLTWMAAQSLASETVDKISFSLGSAGSGASAIAVGGALIPAGSILQKNDSGSALVKFKSATQYLFNPIENGVIPSAMDDNKYLNWTKQP